VCNFSQLLFTFIFLSSFSYELPDLGLDEPSVPSKTFDHFFLLSQKKKWQDTLVTTIFLLLKAEFPHQKSSGQPRVQPVVLAVIDWNLTDFYKELFFLILHRNNFPISLILYFCLLLSWIITHIPFS
jgi:hypothetical protein